MDATFLGAMLALGFASGVHCVGMCGGFAAAFGIRGQGRNYSVVFNLGRISTYAVAGAFAGALGWYAGSGQTALLVLANLVLVFVGLHLAGLRGPMRFFERLGAPLWRRLQPFAVRFMRRTDLASSYAAGLLWGALPCGLVYGALTAAAFAGSPAAGAAAMLAFGLGTLPWLLAAGVAAAKLRQFISRPPVRLAVGAGVLASGVAGLAYAGTSYLCS